MAEAHTNGPRWQAGLFGGYAWNPGSRHVLMGRAYARGANIRDVFRVSPRLVFNSAKLRLAAEVELISAGYGTPDTKGKVRDARAATNFRPLPATCYFF